MLLIAAAVAVGWIAGTPLASHGAGGVTMVLSTALSLCLAGLALAGGGLLSERARGRLQLILGSGVALTGAWALVGRMSGLDLMIDWPELHRWADPDLPRPGRMSPPTALTLLLAGAALVLMNRVRAPWQGLAVQGLTALVAAMGAIGLLGWLLKLHLVYQNYVFEGMSLLTAMCLILVAAGSWLDWRRRDWYHGRHLIANEGLHISLNAIGLLAVLLTVTLAAGIGIVARQLHVGARAHLLEPLNRRAEQFRSAIELRAAQAGMVRAIPGNLALLRNLNAQPADEKTLALLRAAAEGLQPHGFSGMAFQNAAGETRAAAGRFSAQPQVALALEGVAAGLVWDEGLVLRTRQPLPNAEAPAGFLLAEQPLPALAAAIASVGDFAARGTVQVCGREGEALRCFGTDAQSVPADAAVSLMMRALRGESGFAVLRGADGVNLITAAGPVAGLRLGMMVQMPAADFYAPLRRDLLIAIALLLGMVSLGAFLVHWRVEPLARQLSLHEQRLKLALDSSGSAVWDLDLGSSMVYLSEQWPTLLGESAQANSTPLEALYELVHPEDVPLLRRRLRAALRSDDVAYDVEHRVRTPAGDWTWVHSVGRVVERDHRGRALRMIGVNTSIARRKQEESFIERRASRDEVTGLPNRMVFTDRLQTAMARARRAPPDRSLMAVLIVSVEEFTDIEEAVGRDAGQAFLKEVTQRIQRSVRATDTIARTGRDEFTVILEELGLTVQACNSAEKIIGALRTEMRIGHAVLTPNASIGIAYYDGVIKVSADELVARAKNAMFDARNEAPNTFRAAL